MLVLLDFSGTEERVSKDDNANGYRGISKIKGWPVTEINEIGNVAQAEPVNQITQCATQKQPESQLAQSAIKPGKGAGDE